jgi:hypothetical protein
MVYVSAMNGVVHRLVLHWRMDIVRAVVFFGVVVHCRVMVVRGMVFVRLRCCCKRIVRSVLVVSGSSLVHLIPIHLINLSTLLSPH